MKIFYIANVRLPTERAHGFQIMKMCEAFSENGAEVELVIPDLKNPEIKDEAFIYYDVEPTFSLRRIKSSDFLGRTLYFGRVLFWIDRLMFMVKLLVTHLPAGSIIYTRDPIFLTLFSKKKHKFILELHSIPTFRWFWSFGARRASSIFVLTDIMKRELIEIGFKKDTIFISPDGVTPEDFNVNISKAKAREKLGLPVDKKIILYTGHLYSWKGAMTIAEAAKEFGDDFLFVFVGGVDLELSQFKKDYGAFSNIKMVPFQKHSVIPKYLAAADILTIPNSGKSKISTSYTSPLKLFEYMASNRPIVASDLPSLREILNEANCFFAKPDDSKSFAEEIKKVINDKDMAEKVAINAYETVKKYTWDNRAKNILNSLRQ